MLEQNKEVAQKYNILQWHERGYTGKGIRIAVFDDGAYLRDSVRTKGEFPFGMDAKASHGSNVAQTLNELAPDPTLVMIDLFNSDAATKLKHAKWIADPANKIDLISCSCIIGSTINDEYWKILKSSGIPMFCAAGNGGDMHKDNDAYSPASFDWTYAIGGIAEYNEQKVSYSNYGEFVECMTYTSPYIQTESGNIIPLSGTSFCQPQACAMAACLLQAGKSIGIRYTRETLLEFISQNCKDYYEAGKDNMSGYGLLVLPDIEKYLEDNAMKIEMWIGNKNAFVDGEPATISVPPKIDNGSTLVPIRFVAEALGCKVDYDNKTKKITITK